MKPKSGIDNTAQHHVEDYKRIETYLSNALTRENELGRRVEILEAENERLGQERDAYHESIGDVTGKLMRALLALKKAMMFYGKHLDAPTMDQHLIYRTLTELWGENWRTEERP